MFARPTPNPLAERIVLNSAYLRAKRRFDMIITLLLLPFLGIAIALIALAIRLDSAGPIFFRQTRIGQNGKTFTLLKFRSMIVDHNAEIHRAAVQRFIQGQPLNPHDSNANRYKLATDWRITRVGRFIRKRSLDELPQFLNVLRGEMSLVGPRPPLPYEVELYSPHDQLRLTGKPGLTGLWQVYGRSRVPFDIMIQMDIAYLQAQSLLFDLQLILRTIFVILHGQGGA
jgi:lipopolysaccharide/colanic/teichoic acid biosynthesis glycosyltransferase